MATVVRMPAALAGATEGAIQSWLAAVGDTIAEGAPLAEIETEKATVEYAAEVGGTVARLLAEPGENVPVGTPIAVLLAAGEGDDAVGPALAAAGAPEQPATGQAPEPESADGIPPTAPAVAAPSPSPVEERREATRLEETRGLRSDGQRPTRLETSIAETSDRIFASPIVRRLARERGLSLDTLQGTGPNGRIVRRDLDGATPETQTATPAAPQSAGMTTTGYTDVPTSRMRRAIARRLTESKSTVPHFYVTAHIEVDRLLELRAQVNEVAERKVSINDFVLKAVALALKKVPAANAIWKDDVIRQFDGVDLAVAVAIEGGLLTPVVRGVDRLGVVAISAQVADLAERARTGRIQQSELEGGSFAVSNLGMYGVDEFSAILNPPQSGILAVSAAKQRPVVHDGELAVATVMTVTLSADHRVVDGAVAAEWMAAFVQLVEHPVGLLLEP